MYLITYTMTTLNRETRILKRNLNKAENKIKKLEDENKNAQEDFQDLQRELLIMKVENAKQKNSLDRMNSRLNRTIANKDRAIKNRDNRLEKKDDEIYQLRLENERKDLLLEKAQEKITIARKEKEVYRKICHRRDNSVESNMAYIYGNLNIKSTTQRVYGWKSWKVGMSAVRNYLNEMSKLRILTKGKSGRQNTYNKL